MKLKAYIRKDVFNFLKQKGIDYFEYSVESNGLKAQMEI